MKCARFSISLGIYATVQQSHWLYHLHVRSPSPLQQRLSSGVGQHLTLATCFLFIQHGQRTGNPYAELTSAFIAAYLVHTIASVKHNPRAHNFLAPRVRKFTSCCFHTSFVRCARACATFYIN